MMYIDELKRVPLFATCSMADLKQLLDCPHKRQSYGAGSLVMRLGDPCLSLMVLTEGAVETRMGSDEGREVVVERIEAPSLLAPVFLFSDNNHMPVEVVAATRAVIWFINREGFARFMGEHPPVMAAFMQTIAEKGTFLAGKVRSFATKGMQGRVLEHLDTHGAITNVTAAAGMLGVSRSALSRVLSDMQAAGLIVRTGEGLVKKG
ncbi:MAG: Crp/Fnr family transcriptional regulator [Bacteroidales bacterium]|nr:Crp/Fnr family transcriptional regulator [Bacteroidales bacterium]